MLLGPVALQTAHADVGTPDLNAAIVAAVHGEKAPEKESTASAAEEAKQDGGGAAVRESRGAKEADDFFADADELGAHASGTDLVRTLSSMVKADLSAAHADGVIRAFAQAKGKDRHELRTALAKVLSDPEISSWIDASPSRVALANELVKRVAPTDPSIAENREVNKVVDSFAEFDKYKYHVIVVTGYTPPDATTATPDVHPVGMARLRDAFDAWKRGDAPFILLSGGNVYPPGTPYYEAIQMKKELVQMGVPADRIIVDARARHSTTNLRNAGRYMFAHGMTKALVASRGGGAGPFDQTFYFAHQGLSSFDGRCERELGYVVGTLTDAGNSMVEFQPSANVGRFNYKDPLDP
ncbi:MAG: YdcF family protein [Polyangiaceae bacterium]|nr:YdcF family protein [Polyangiaceae bacterium]